MGTAPILVFDGDCSFCTNSVRWLGHRAVFTALPWQFADLDDLGLSTAEVQDSVWFISGESGAVGGADAFRRLLGQAHRPWWRAAGAVMGWPVVLPLARQVYRLVARNRHRMPGGTPTCSLRETPHAK